MGVLGGTGPSFLKMYSSCIENSTSASVCTELINYKVWWVYLLMECCFTNPYRIQVSPYVSLKEYTLKKHAFLQISQSYRKGTLSAASVVAVLEWVRGARSAPCSYLCVADRQLCSFCLARRVSSPYALAQTEDDLGVLNRFVVLLFLANWLAEYFLSSSILLFHGSLYIVHIQLAILVGVCLYALEV